jgi:hypothetical protein
MALYIITYDIRTRPGHDYQPLYDLLTAWRAAHLQNSVWLVESNNRASVVRDSLLRHMHRDDTFCVNQIFSNSDWATWNARREGVDWLKPHMAA